MAASHRLLGLALAASLAACGGSSPSTPSSPPPTTTPPPQRTLIAQGSRSDIPPLAQDDVVFFLVVQINGPGTLEGTVDWTFASNLVGLVWASGNCIQNPNCAPLVQDTTFIKPKTITAPNLAAGTYTLVVANLGTTNESIAYQIFLTR